MITIQKGQSIKEDKNVVVVSASGTYSDYDLIVCEDITDPTRPQMSFQAQYIAYGPMIYQFGDKFEELGKELLVLDPTSNHDAVVYFKDEEVRRLRREGGMIRPAEITPNEILQEQPQSPNMNQPTPSAENTPVSGTPISESTQQPVQSAPATETTTPTATSTSPAETPTEVTPPPATEEVQPTTPSAPVEVVPPENPVVQPPVEPTIVEPVTETVPAEVTPVVETVVAPTETAPLEQTSAVIEY